MDWIQFFSKINKSTPFLSGDTIFNMPYLKNNGRTQPFGKLAEQKACQFLEQKGYCCIEKNYRVGRAEIDLIMQRGEILICVEVKARKTQFFGTPASFISSAKIKRLCAAMDHYIIQKELNVEVRFDVIECIVQQNQWIINHIPNAFYPWE